MKLSLGQKITGSILVTFLIAALAFSLVLIPLQNQRIDNAVEESTSLLKILVDREAEPMANALFEGRVRAIHLRLKDILDLDGMLSLTVCDSRGQVISHIDRLGGEPEYTDMPTHRYSRGYHTHKTLWHNVPALYFETPITATNETFGFIRIAYSMAKIEKERRLAYFAYWGLLGAILLVMVLFMNFLLSAIIRKPIRTLQNAISRVQKEGPGVTVPVSSQDEIGHLTSEFNRMSNELNNLLKRLQIEIDDRREAEHALDQKRKELITVNELARIVTTQSSLKEACDAAVQTLSNALGIEMAMLFLKEGENLILNASGPSRWREDVSPIPEHRVGECICGLSVQNRQPIYSLDINNDPRCSLDECKNSGIRSFAAIPLCLKDSVIGVLGVASKSRRDFKRISHFLETAADELAIALHNFKLLEQTREYAAQLEQEIANHEQTENALRDSEFRFRSHVNSSPEGILFFDLDANLIDSNKRVSEITGYKAEELMGKRYETLLSEKSKALLKETIQAYETGFAQEGSFELDIQKKDGSTIWLLVRAWLAKNQDNMPAVFGTFIRDITGEKSLAKEKKALEDQLFRTQKMEAIGTLAGGIAHDFNNILSGIMGNTELALMTVGDTNEKIKKYLNRSLDASNRAKELVQQILKFSRKEASALGPTHLKTLLKEAVKLSRSTLPTTITIQEFITAEHDTVMGDATQLHQVFMNLFVNAYHAMKNTGGTLSIGLRNIELKETRNSAGEAYPPGEYILLTVEDTGTGIEPDVMDRIFNPYFTTKKAEEGTGLGLAVTFGVIKNHQGFIEVESAPGTGARFSIYLPVSRDKSKKIVVRHDELPMGNHEKLLVVDDEEFFLDVIRETLNSLTYDVSAHNSSLKTLEIFQQNPESFDAIITDQTMPEMTGIQLIAEIRQLNKTIPIILCTGYSDEVTEESSKLFNVNRLMHKPISRDKLAKAVHDVLKESAERAFSGSRFV